MINGSFTITNTGGTPLTITKSKPPGLGVFTAVTQLDEGTSIPAGESRMEIVSFISSVAGTFTDQWIITGNDGSGVHNVTMTGTVTPPGTGVLGTYFPTQNLTGTPLTRTDPTIYFDWGSGSPDPSIPVDHFSARWTGSLRAPATDAYTIYARADDGVRVWLGGTLIIDEWIDQAPTEYAVPVNLVAGQPYDLKMEYYENAGGAVAQLSWSSASIGKEAIPTASLYPPGSGSDGGAGGAGGTGTAGADGGAGSGGAGGMSGSGGVGGMSGSGGAGGMSGSGGGGTGGSGGAGGSSGSGGSSGGAGMDGGVDAAMDAGTPEVPQTTVPPDPPASFAAAVLDRRQTSVQLTWVAPATSWGAAVSSYRIRYAKVAITSSNFDDTSVTTAVPYTGKPAAVGASDGAVVKGLVVENGYYFAVESVDADGNQSSPVATSSATTAHFNLSTLTGSGATNEAFGFQMSSSGDVNGDGKADLLVGVTNGAHAYLYLANAGSGATPPTAPVTVFSAGYTPTSFGRGVSIIGDVDHDGIDDLAVSDRLAPAHVYIYKGRSTWPATLTAAQADYVITPDATYSNNALFGAAIARLGDFNGDGVDDFAVGAHLYGSMQNGRVVIVLGKAGFGSVQLPDAANTIVIDADPSLPTPLFGYRILGLGHFYPGAGTTLVIGAPGTTSGTTGSEGHIYAFRGQNGTGGVIPVGSADSVVVGNALQTRVGAVLSNLGPMLNSLPSVGTGNPTDRTVLTGTAWLFSGDTTAGPFASNVVVEQPTSGTINSAEGLIGGRLSGSDQTFSLIGDGSPDLIQIPQKGSGFFIIDGKVLAGPPPATSPIDSSIAGAVAFPFPAGWGATAESGGALLPDINGDGYSDFAISSASGLVPGSVVIYW